MTDRMRTIMTVDIGNTAMKCAVFEGERLVRSVVCTEGGSDALFTLLGAGSVDGVSYCCVGEDCAGVAECLRRCGLPFMALGPETRLPVEVCYDSRRTLGVDRVAAAVGVAEPGETRLVVDAGTAVTVDFVSDMRFLGGNISPGLRLRFRSLHEFTSRLPLVSPEGDLPLFGRNTQTAIRAGVVRGLVSELADIFAAARFNYENIKMVLTGGDAAILFPLLVARGIDVVADSEAVGRGLVRIFNYNTSYD